MIGDHIHEPHEETLGRSIDRALIEGQFAEHMKTSRAAWQSTWTPRSTTCIHWSGETIAQSTRLVVKHEMVIKPPFFDIEPRGWPAASSGSLPQRVWAGTAYRGTELQDA